MYAQFCEVMEKLEKLDGGLQQVSDYKLVCEFYTKYDVFKP